MENVDWKAVARSLARMYEDTAECDNCEVIGCHDRPGDCADAILDYVIEELQKGD